MEEMRKQVIAMQRKINDLMDDHGAAAAGRLKAEVQGLEDDLQVKKNARTIEDRVKRIVNLLGGEARTARIMNYEHLKMFQDWFENLRNSLRKMS